nr:MAG TPA: hypothetical protein [Caudoviricetes sp.]
MKTSLGSRKRRHLICRICGGGILACISDEILRARKSILYSMKKCVFGLVFD